mgnify:CR=1 FL=1
MARMRAVKQQLKDLLSAPDWRDHLPGLRSMGQPAVGPLFSFLSAPRRRGDRSRGLRARESRFPHGR